MLGIEVIGKGNKESLGSSMDVGPPPGGTRCLTVAYVDLHGIKSDVGCGLIPH